MLFYSTSATLAKEVKAEYNKGGAVDLAARDDVHLCALLLKASRATPRQARCTPCTSARCYSGHTPRPAVQPAGFGVAWRGDSYLRRGCGTRAGRVAGRHAAMYLDQRRPSGRRAIKRRPGAWLTDPCRMAACRVRRPSSANWRSPSSLSSCTHSRVPPPPPPPLTRDACRQGAGGPSSMSMSRGLCRFGLGCSGKDLDHRASAARTVAILACGRPATKACAGPVQAGRPP